MVNSPEFIWRLERILEFYGFSASAFADRIDVQRSSISHLLTGRNKPSLEFVLKVVKTFPEVNLYWLLNGKGQFPSKNTPEKQTRTGEGPIAGGEAGTPSTSIRKIVIFYEDGSFRVFDRNLDHG